MQLILELYSVILESGLCLLNKRYFCRRNHQLTNIDYITIASEGNAIDFGVYLLARLYGSGLSSSTRGIFGQESTPVQQI
jgi:hypothetical protein